MISSDKRSTNPEHFTLILWYWRLPPIILDVWLCLTTGHVDWNEMVDLYVAAGVKQQEIFAGGFNRRWCGRRREKSWQDALL